MPDELKQGASSAPINIESFRNNSQESVAVDDDFSSQIRHLAMPDPIPEEKPETPKTPDVAKPVSDPEEPRSTPTPDDEEEQEAGDEPSKETPTPGTSAPSEAVKSQGKKSANARIQELTAKNRALEEKLSKTQTPTPDGKTPSGKPEAPRYIQPPPPEPKFGILTKENVGTYKQSEVQAMYNKCLAEGDTDNAKLWGAALADLQANLEYRVARNEWESKEKDAWNQINQKASFYNGIIQKDHPDFFKTDSELSKTIELMGKNDPNLKEFLDFAQNDASGYGKYLLAKAATNTMEVIKLTDSLGALKKENESLKKGIQTRDKKLSPVAPKDADEVGAAPGREEQSPEEWLDSQLGKVSNKSRSQRYERVA